MIPMKLYQIHIEIVKKTVTITTLIFSFSDLYNNLEFAKVKLHNK